MMSAHSNPIFVCSQIKENKDISLRIRQKKSILLSNLVPVLVTKSVFNLINIDDFYRIIFNVCEGIDYKILRKFIIRHEFVIFFIILLNLLRNLKFLMILVCQIWFVGGNL